MVCHQLQSVLAATVHHNTSRKNCCILGFLSLFFSTYRALIVCDSIDTLRASTERLKMKWGSCYLLVTILWFWLVKLMHISTADAALDSEDENILKVLRSAIALPSWRGDPCTEKWIECDSERVSSLKLDGKNLIGTIPTDIAKLRSLTSIEFNENQLFGPIPDVRNLTELINLSLESNSLTSIPSDLRDLTLLESVNIRNNVISGNLPELPSDKLNWIYFANNNFSGEIPDSWADLFHLRQLSLESNSLTSIPSDLRSLTSLQFLDVRNNVISGNLPELRSDKLKWIDFSSNHFSGKIPRSWADLSSLEELNVSHNMLGGMIPKDIMFIRQLKKLNLSHNLFDGPIPEEITYLERLQILDLRHNNLSGIVPEGFASLAKLQALYLDNNNFTGIPVALTKRENLIISPADLKVIFESDNVPAARSGSSLSTRGIVGLAAGAIGAGILVLAITLLLLARRKKYKHQISKEDMPKSAQAFNLKQVKAMTQNFKKLIGRGGFGPVYYGKLPNGKEVAVKVRAMDSKQGVEEFTNEVRLLSRLHHRNLVPLVGYCLEAQEQILIYTYMAQGTLHDHLHINLSGSSSSKKKTNTNESFIQPLDWRMRLHIAINAARGLEYLHKDCNPPVIHRDVKSSNILLTEKLEAKFGDLGISKQAHEQHTEETLNMMGISTAIKGTIGYLDPEYFTRQRLTSKSDVYGFGIILLEMITGKRAICKFPDSDPTSLKDWVEDTMSENNITCIADPVLKGEYSEEGMLMVAKTALSCVLPTGAERPEMGDIVRTLIDAIGMERILPRESLEGTHETIVPLCSQHLSISSIS